MFHQTPKYQFKSNVSYMDFKSYQDLHNELLNKWSEYPDDKEKRFTFDGIVAQTEEDYVDWENSKAKILFLVKEAYADYEPTIPVNIKRTFHLNMARWKYLIEGFFANGEIPEYPDNEMLRKKNTGIAIVEVKKYDEGNSTSNYQDILNYAKRDASLLQEQIKLINPDVILCAGTFTSYEDGIFEAEKRAIAHEYYGILEDVHASIYTHRGRTILNFYHPSYVKSPEKLYGLLADLFLNRNSLKK